MTSFASRMSGIGCLVAIAIPATLSGTTELTQVITGTLNPTQITHAGDGSRRLFAVDQNGFLRVILPGNSSPEGDEFLDIESVVNFSGQGDEEGLLSVAFHPDYESNGFFYVYYTNLSGNQQISRFTNAAPEDNGPVSAATEEFVISIAHPTNGNHNGGQLMFGPNDGYLYIGTGDGGGSCDPGAGIGNAQSLTSNLGKILRIDVDGDDFPGDANRNYEIPAGNPYAGVAGNDEIWHYGLRNPWRWSFDRYTGDLFIGDVGQGAWEEASYVPATQAAPVSLGWGCCEGASNSGCAGHNDSADCGLAANSCADVGVDSHGNTYLPPIATYPNPAAESSAVVGGFRYRGLDVAGLRDFDGRYVFADTYSGQVSTSRTANGGATWTTADLLVSSGFPESFGEDEKGELYLTDAAGDDVYRFTDPDTIFTDTFESQNTGYWSATEPSL